MFPLESNGSFTGLEDRIRSCVFLKGHSKRLSLNDLQMAERGLTQLSRADLLCFPEARVYGKNTPPYYQWGEVLQAYIGQPGTHRCQTQFEKSVRVFSMLPAFNLPTKICPVKHQHVSA